jgi:hypothetical protein
MICRIRAGVYVRIDVVISNRFAKEYHKEPNFEPVVYLYLYDAEWFDVSTL